MTPEQQDRWNRIRHFQIDAPNASFPFSVRLARENGWTPTYAARVVEEYRRFAFLAIASGHGVTPSKAVDEAWHLHLLYTQNYWEEFCPQALGRPLHHHPSNGNTEDDAKYEGWYENTLESYERLFAEPPPADIWPGTTAPTKRRWPFLALLAPFLAGCNEPANPLDWHGPEFLQLFFVLYGLALIAALATRHALLGPASGPPAEDWQLHVYDQATLNGGGRLALATALARLTASNALEVDQKTKRMRTIGSVPNDGHPLDRAILRAAEADRGVLYDSVHRRTKPFLDELETSLRRQGLWSGAIAAATALPFTLATLPLLLGVAKIFVGLDRNRPVGFLIIGCIAAFIVNLLFLTPPKRTPYGGRVLGQLRTTRPNARPRSLAPDDLACGVALFGIDALASGDLAYLRPAIMPAPTSSGDGGSSSSCGGGGGCGGGGCGGCGGS